MDNRKNHMFYIEGVSKTMVTLIQTVYQFLWGDLITLPLPGGAGIKLFSFGAFADPYRLFILLCRYPFPFPAVYLRIC